MCGIAAQFAYDHRAAALERGSLQATCDRMQCRGPDGAGLWWSADERVGLGHRRLAIIDLSDRGAQPMHDRAGRTSIAFNGEIYNYRALRSELEAGGHRFVSDSDTEVLLRLYAEFGVGMVRRLRGMFAFALWDDSRSTLVFARDPFGIKPLYYADDGRTIRAASEVKALLAGGHVDTAPAPAGHVGFHLWGHIPEPWTLYRGIRALPAGHTLQVTRGERPTLARYADVGAMLALAEREAAVPDEARDAQEEIREAVRDTVRHHLVADVDVGVFLSAGLDSTTIAAVAAEHGGGLQTVTLGFAEFRGTEHDETPLAEHVARAYGTEHRTIWVTRDDFRRELERLLDRMDQPSIDGVNSYFVARAAAEAGLKVALSGLGGDELLGGYPSFRELPRTVNALQRVPCVGLIGRGARTLSAPLVAALSSPKYASVLEYGSDWGGAYMLRRGLLLPWELPRILDRELAEAGLRELRMRERLNDTVAGISTDRLKVTALEASWYMRNQLLRDTDWASMTHSLEVRVPLVDWTLWQRVAPLLAAHPTLGKTAMALSPRQPLPDVVLHRRKTGFSVPTRHWLLGNADKRYAGRGLRGWARYVHERAA